MPLSDIVQVNISLQAAQLAAAGFGVPMIAGLANHWSDRFRIYTGMTGLEADGYTSSDPEHEAAAALLAQDNKPASFVIGRRLAAVAQADQITVTAVTVGNVYTATITNVTTGLSASASYTAIGGDTTTSVATGLNAAIAAIHGTTLVTGAASTNHVNLTADVAGNGFTVALAGTGAAQMTDANTTPNHGMQEDLSDFLAAGASWYGTLIVSRGNDDIRNLARWTESHVTPPTIAMAQTSEAASASAVVSVSGTDLANRLHQGAYRRTALWYHTLDGEYLDAAITGRELPVDAGAENWALKKLALVSPDNLSDTFKVNLQGATPNTAKNANIYYPLRPGGLNPITSRGTMASGEWIDVIRLIDFLTARIGEAVGNLFLSVERVPFDENGIQQIASAIRGVLQAAKDAGKLSSYTVTTPAITSISSADRAARRLNPPITFLAQLSGAFDFAQINGTVVE